MTIRNIKASFILDEKVASPSKWKNFVVKQNTFVITTYGHCKNLVNVTGMKSFGELKEAKEIIEDKLKRRVIKVRIDNTFFSKKNYENVDMYKVYAFMEDNRLFHVDYNIELFAGMYFHPKKSEYPTILFFRTGSYTMLGAKKKSILMECEHFVINLINMFNKKSNKRLMKYLQCLFQYSVHKNLQTVKYELSNTTIIRHYIIII